MVYLHLETTLLGNDGYSLNKYSRAPVLSLMLVSGCPLCYVKFFINHYKYQTHTTHSLSYTFKSLSSNFRKSDFLSFLTLETLNFLQLLMATSTSGSSMQLTSGSNYSIKPLTMSIPTDSLEVQIESLVDFASLKLNDVDMEALISAQKMFDYFHLLNGPTYVNLVKEFWIRAEVCDVETTKSQENQVVSRNPSLKGKSRQEMGLEPFKGLEIKSAVMGIPISITEGVIARAC